MNSEKNPGLYWNPHSHESAILRTYILGAMAAALVFVVLESENLKMESPLKKIKTQEQNTGTLKSPVSHHYYLQYQARFSKLKSFLEDFSKLVLGQRYKMVKWIVDQYHIRWLQRETLFLSVSLLDRVLERGFFEQEGDFQLLGVACLYLAARINEPQEKAMCYESKFYVGDDTYSRCEVIGMVTVVQKVLNFKVLVPTIYDFLELYLKAGKADVEMERRIKYLAELSLFSHQRLHYLPSTVAAALVRLASSRVPCHIDVNQDGLPECIKCLEWLRNC